MTGYLFFEKCVDYIRNLPDEEHVPKLIDLFERMREGPVGRRMLLTLQHGALRRHGEERLYGGETK